MMAMSRMLLWNEASCFRGYAGRIRGGRDHRFGRHLFQLPVHSVNATIRASYFLAVHELHQPEALTDLPGNKRQPPCAESAAPW